MIARHYLPIQYGFGLGTQHYVQRKVNYGALSVLYYQFTAPPDGAEIFAVPDGCADIQFNCDKIAPCITLCGTVLRHKVLEYACDKTYFGVRFPPSISRHLCRLPYKELVGQQLSVDSLGIPCSEVHGRLSTATHFDERLSIVERWLKGLGALSAPKHDALDLYLERILTNDGDLRVSELAAEFKVSDRYFRKKFHEAVGVSPKRFSRIMRFQKTLEDWLLSGQPLSTDAHTSMSVAYYDESHLAKECLEFANASPKTLADKLRMARPTRPV